MTSHYQLTGIEKADISADRSCIEISLRTSTGPVMLTVTADQLAALITALQSLEYHASLMNPTIGAKPDEPGQMRMEIVEQIHTGCGDVNGVPSALVGLMT